MLNMSPETIKIYSTPGCGWAIRNYAALIEKGIPFAIVMAKDPAGRKTEEFLALSPYARTPVISVDGEVVWDSSQMNFYIDELFPEPALMPAKPVERAQARLWIRHCDHELFPVVSGLKGIPDAKARAHLRKGLLQLLEHGFVGRDTGEFWLGSQISLVDLCYATLFDTLDVLQEMAGPNWLEVPDQLLHWRDAIRAHPTMQQANSIPESLSFDTETKFIYPSNGGTVADTA